MPLTLSARGRRLVAACVVVAVACACIAAAHAQGSPAGGAFGPRPGAAPAAGGGGVTGYILAKQAEFYRLLSSAIRAVKADGSAVGGLLGLSFLYGVFHAAGPGHGKAVISSYLIANRETWRRGVVLSFLSAMVQALVAVAIVSFAAFAIQATRQTICNAEPWTEIASYGLIAAVGASLLWTKGRALIAAVRPAESGATFAFATPQGSFGKGAFGERSFGETSLSGRACCGHDHGPGVMQCDGVHHDADCGHSHGPQPQDLAGPGGWRRGIAAIFAVGLRPCSGAIIVLVFALAQGLYWAGIASAFAMGFGTALTVTGIATLAVAARSIAARLAAMQGGRGVIALRALEALAAAAVLAFGLTLLLGYVATERLSIAC